ncbi:Ku protein [Streptomyces sp. NPDC054933]
MRSSWKGAIGFGLVSILVALYVATEDHGIPLRMAHAADGGRIRQKRVSERCGNEVEYRDTARGYEDPTGRTAVLTEESLALLRVHDNVLVLHTMYWPDENFRDGVNGVHLGGSDRQRDVLHCQCVFRGHLSTDPIVH